MRPASRSLAVLANVTAVYPLFALGALYGQWLLSWWILGHRPRPSLDDPGYIVGASWLGYVTGFALLGLVPVGCCALVLNCRYVLHHERRGVETIVRIGLVVLLWLGALVLVRTDPGRVVSWWLD